MFLGKWENVLKSGMGHNLADYNYFNEYAVHMLQREDVGITVVRRLEKAIFELKAMDKRSFLLRGDDKKCFRNRLLMKKEERANKEQEEVKQIVDS